MARKTKRTISGYSYCLRTEEGDFWIGLESSLWEETVLVKDKSRSVLFKARIGPSEVLQLVGVVIQPENLFEYFVTKTTEVTQREDWMLVQ